MKALADRYPVQELCVAFGGSRSGYDAWHTRAPSGRAQADARLTTQLCAAHDASRRIYGSLRLVIMLRRQGQRLRHRLVQRQRWVPHPTESRHGQPIAPNRLAELPAPQHRDPTWLMDITYVFTDEGWLYGADGLPACQALEFL